jgi:hypothetical protein
MRILLDHYYIACGVCLVLIASSQLRRASSVSALAIHQIPSSPRRRGYHTRQAGMIENFSVDGARLQEWKQHPQSSVASVVIAATFIPMLWRLSPFPAVFITTPITSSGLNRRRRIGAEVLSASHKALCV